MFVASSTDAANIDRLPNPLVMALEERRQTRSRRGALQLAAAAMVGILVGGTGGRLVFGRTTRDDGTKVIASMTMSTLPSETGTATASLSQRADGTRLVMIAASALTPNPGGFYQVWLLDKSGTKAISLGPLGPDEHGQFQLPKDLDLAAFPVLDVSAQVCNGNRAHSSHSIVRDSLPV